jgi:hypothetical protein
MKVSKQRVSLPNPNTLAPKPNPKASQQVGTLPKGCGKVRRCVGWSLNALFRHFHVDVFVQRVCKHVCTVNCVQKEPTRV